LTLASERPTLYIEFRKDGQPVDPRAWWKDEMSSERQAMIRKVTLLAVGALMGATAVSAINSFGGSADAAGAATYRQLAIFGNVFERVRAQYVTPPEEDKLIESAIDGMLTSLDPHSSYLNQEAADDMRTQTRGEFGGLGIEVTMEDELVKVITPIDETPAARAGVLAGDFISEIDGEPVRGLSLGRPSTRCAARSTPRSN
jgi:carboxyl-terminal processing protease